MERIAHPGVVIYPGCRLEGKDTLILGGAELGAEGPVHIRNCMLGPHVALKGGFFEGAVFLAGAQMGLGAHVRSGTILEEGARGAHTVALKQTLLFPYVTLGSLINFCDCFMAGGTSKTDHSEVGSSFIHFNFTPNQDKATPSLLGDVPRGVMLDQHPIFLGGQGGVVGPCRMTYGTVTAAGSIIRHDILKGDQVVLEGLHRSLKVAATPGKYTNIQRILVNNFHYIANLKALSQWYRHVRPCFAGAAFPPELLQGLQINLASQIEERLRRLGQLADKMAVSRELCPPAGREYQRQDEFRKQWPGIQDSLGTLFNSHEPGPAGDAFLLLLTGDGNFVPASYPKTMGRLSAKTKTTGRLWLQNIVDGVLADLQSLLPAFTILP